MPIQRPLVFAAFVLSALLLGGCAGGRQTQGSGAARQTLPRGLALQLATASDDIARKLAGGDPCAARNAAVRLQQQTVRAIDAGRVPTEFRGTLRSTANDLASRIRCVVPPPSAPQVEPAAPTEQSGNESHGKNENHGKHKGRGKHDGKDEGD
jgi:hypothetical protein